MHCNRFLGIRKSEDYVRSLVQLTLQALEHKEKHLKTVTNIK